MLRTGGSVRSSWWAGIALGLLALNLRTFVGSVGVVLPEVRTSLAMTVTTAAVVTTLPVLVFALAGPVAPRLVARIGLRGCALGCLGVLVLALVARSFATTTWWFVAMTALAPSAVAVGNIILPAAAQQFFPRRVALAASVATVLAVLGGAISSATTVSLAQLGGSWRLGLGGWGLLAGLGFLVWVLMPRRRSRSPGVVPAGTRWSEFARAPMAWAMALVFAAQSMSAYVGFGWLAEIYRSGGAGPVQAGWLVGVWSLLGVPTGLAVPALLRHRGGGAWMPWLWAVTGAAGWLGLGLFPGHLVWVWTILLGVASGAFPWIMTMIALRGGSLTHTAQLSGFVQTVGYLVAVVGPFGVGALHGVSGNWTVPLIVVALVTATMGPAGARVVAGHSSPPSTGESNPGQRAAG
ncbi:MAG: MFS transporter [Propionibacteriaceae bacterium]